MKRTRDLGIIPLCCAKKPFSGSVILSINSKAEDNNKILRDFSVRTIDGSAITLTKFEAYHLNINDFIKEVIYFFISYDKTANIVITIYK